MKQRIGMSVTDNASIRLKRLDTEVQARMREFMYKSAEKIRDLARLNAPVDNTHVESAIEVEVERFQGLNRAHTVKVGIDWDKLRGLRAEAGLSTQFRYDQWLHEAEYNLGEKSEEKNTWVRSFHPKASVGNQFLLRSYLDLKAHIERGAVERARSIIRARNKK